VLRQNLAGERLDFAEGDGFEPAGLFQSKAEAADPAEQIKDAEGAHAAPAEKRRASSAITPPG
jgi:hypothetical protein